MRATINPAVERPVVLGESLWSQLEEYREISGSSYSETIEEALGQFLKGVLAKIQAEELEPGGQYRGRSGQIKEIVKIDGHLCLFRVIRESYRKCSKDPLPVGAEDICELRDFARWAVAEVA